MSEQYKNAVCRGSWALGTACGKCERCIETNPHKSKHMSEQKAAFEAWYDNDISEPLPDDYTILGKRYLYMGWCAATAEANKRIAELEGEVAELKASELEALRNSAFYSQKALEIKASNKHLREALEKVKAQNDKYGKDGRIDHVVVNAIYSTPAESLAKHDDVLIERCAKECEYAATPYRDADKFYICAEAVRALKGE